MMSTCPGCNTHYSIDERRIAEKGASLTCRECGSKWMVRRATPASGAVAAEAPASPPIALDSSASLRVPVTCPKCGHFFVPLSTGPQPVGAGRPADDARPRARVLLVEDQKYFAELTREALGDEFETNVVANLGEARSVLQNGTVDLVILDLSLEGNEDGTQVLQATRARGIPVLVFTARDETELYGGIWDSLKAAGATDILIKGVNVGDELRQKVTSLLSHAKS